jgi:hypothetical protein
MGGWWVAVGATPKIVVVQRKDAEPRYEAVLSKINFVEVPRLMSVTYTASVRAVTLLPDPDSPTSPRHSPRSRVRIGTIVKAGLVILHIEHDRTT